ncbi:MAG TPA: GntR family transcriptional regulator [Pseudonocardia sp.]|jgi:DNA-binding GntR family transcriptional regulator|uniref:GntR family transcriptional regulator n=1 Tax=Pseudonocardia sp. TaxID=60912 RepID=UPI002CCDBAD4|nr:GntR family transcriptional regulator [Pseudonocardia sp.]HTF51448.1 GntR family transcriptional regulator [Pseudonocardia sp.]
MSVTGAQAPASTRIARPIPLRESVQAAILDMIVSRELRPGQHLVENELATLLGVSRQPVREALQGLRNDGWVELRPGHGAFVHAPSVEEADQLLTVRRLLEAESAALAARNADDAGVHRLRQIYQRGIDALAADDVDGVVKANAELHAEVTQLSRNTVLIELTYTVAQRVRWLHAPVARSRGKDSWVEHLALIDAIANGDAVTAGQIMAAHTEHTRRSYLDSTAKLAAEASSTRPSLHRAH